jgi:hypothetical protein
LPYSISLAADLDSPQKTWVPGSNQKVGFGGAPHVRSVLINTSKFTPGKGVGEPHFTTFS